jgi:hypothetical protein
MVWDDRDLNAHQIALRERVATLAHVRAENPALSRGSRTTHSVSQDTWVYTMGGCGDSANVTVAINRADASRTVEIPAGAYADLLDGGTHAGGSIELDPRSFVLLRHE